LIPVVVLDMILFVFFNLDIHLDILKDN